MVLRISPAVFCVLSLVIFSAPNLNAEDAPAGVAGVDAFAKQSSVFLAKYCTSCHGADTQEAELRFDDVPLDAPKKNVTKVITMSLDGDKWRFLADPKHVGEKQNWAAVDYDDGKWKAITVPGYWEGDEEMEGPICPNCVRVYLRVGADGEMESYDRFAGVTS